jgi:hypothetical protein
VLSARLLDRQRRGLCGRSSRQHAARRTRGAEQHLTAGRISSALVARASDDSSHDFLPYFRAFASLIWMEMADDESVWSPPFVRVD